MLIKKRDPFTGKLNSLEINVTQRQIDLWQSGTFIQDAMPTITPTEREFIMTGIWEDSWDSYVLEGKPLPIENKIESFIASTLPKKPNTNLNETCSEKIDEILNPKRD